MLYKAATSSIYARKRIVSKLYTDRHYYHSGCKPNSKSNAAQIKGADYISTFLNLLKITSELSNKSSYK